MKQPVRVKLEAGEKYLFCTCGNSEDGVLCDGSHKGSAFVPKEFIATRTAESYLCRCKKSYNGVYCDGNHAKRETFNLDFLDS